MLTSFMNILDINNCSHYINTSYITDIEEIDTNTKENDNIVIFDIHFVSGKKIRMKKEILSLIEQIEMHSQSDLSFIHSNFFIVKNEMKNKIGYDLKIDIPK